VGVECEVFDETGHGRGCSAARNPARQANHSLKTVPRRPPWRRDEGSKGKQQGDHRQSAAERFDGKRSKTARQHERQPDVCITPATMTFEDAKFAHQSGFQCVNRKN